MAQAFTNGNGVHLTAQEDAAAPHDISSPALVLVQATPAEIALQTQKNSVIWRGALSLEAYIRREAHIANQTLSRDSGLTSWVLVSTAVEPSNRKVLASCETLRKRALWTKDGKLHDIISHGIGSVFVPEEYRSRGYGRRMMQDLSVKLRTWQAEQLPCLFSVLYSDIGKKFYARYGWHPCPSSHVHLHPDASTAKVAEQVTLLHTADLPHLCNLDESLIRHKLLTRPRKTAAVALIPDYKTMEWHHAREEFVSSELLGKKPSVKGALANINGHRVWAIWTRMWYNEDPKATKGNTLHILRLCIEDEVLDIEGEDVSEDHIAGIAAVLRVAQQQAHEWKMEEVELWNPHSRSLLAVQRLDPAAKLIERDSESIASLKWYGEGDEEVEWCENEKFGWC